MLLLLPSNKFHSLIKTRQVGRSKLWAGAEFWASSRGRAAILGQFGVGAGAPWCCSLAALAEAVKAQLQPQSCEILVYEVVSKLPQRQIVLRFLF